MRPYRKERVAKVIQQVVSEAIVHSLHDPRVAPLTTVTRVEMTGDLVIARIYLSVPHRAAVESRTLRAIRHAAPYLQRRVASVLTIRQCPELRFYIDAGVRGARHTLELIAENRRDDPQLMVPDETDTEEGDRQVPPVDGESDATASNPDLDSGACPDRSQELGA